jgi:hypothetical protein
MEGINFFIPAQMRYNLDSWLVKTILAEIDLRTLLFSWCLCPVVPWSTVVVCENFNPKTDPLLSSSMRRASFKCKTPWLELKSSRSFLAIKQHEARVNCLFLIVVRKPTAMRLTMKSYEQQKDLPNPQPRSSRVKGSGHTRHAQHMRKMWWCMCIYST